MCAGSTLIATGDVAIDATRDLAITSAQNTAVTATTANTSRSGVGAMGGISNGQRTIEQQATSASTTQIGSTIASLNGNVSLSAGRDALVRASTVSAAGDIALSGANVIVENAVNSATSTDSYRLAEHGRTVTASSPVLQQLQGIARMAEAADGAQDSRVQAMAAATAAMQASSLAQSLASGNVTAVSINISYGARSSQNATTTSVNAVAGSSLSAGGNVTVNATGKEPGASGTGGNLTLTGSTISGGGDVSLTAANDLTLQAARNTAQVASTNSSHGASVGIAINLGTQNGITINASANQASGHANGQDLTHTLATVSAGGTLSTSSGRNTTLTGAVGSGSRIVTDVGTSGSGDLTITSVQDASTFEAQQRSAGVGVSICIPPICYGTSSASVSIGRAGASGNYLSVAEQAGLRAGDGGFAVNVAGRTALTGAAITSTQAAVDTGKNSLGTDTLTQAALRNEANAQALALSASGSVSGAVGDQSTASTPAQRQAATQATSAGTRTNASAGVGAVDERDASVTTSGISGATITVRNGTVPIGLDRSVTTETISAAGSANTLARPRTGAELLAESQTGAQVMQAFVPQAANAIGSYADRQRDALLAQANAEKDPDKKTALSNEAARWDEGGAYRVAAHTTLGALTGGVSGAAGAGASAAAAPAIDRLQLNLRAELEAAGMHPEAAQAASGLISVGAATLVGAAAGGGNVNAAAMAGNVDANNRQTRTREQMLIDQAGRGLTAAQRQVLEDAACALTKCAASVDPDSPRYAAAVASQARGSDTSLAQVRAALASSGMFGYTNADLAGDLFDRVVDPLALRGSAALDNFIDTVRNTTVTVARSGPTHPDLPPDLGGGNPPGASGGVIALVPVPLCVGPLCTVAPAPVGSAQVPVNVVISSNAQGGGGGSAGSDDGANASGSDGSRPTTPQSGSSTPPANSSSPRTSEGTANAATAPRLADDLRQAEANPTAGSTTYRGGSSLELRPRDVEPGSDGLLHPYRENGRAQGVSVNIDPLDRHVQRNGGAFPVNSIPEGLQLLPDGRPGHFVIAPAEPMTIERFKQLLSQVQLGNFNVVRP